MVRSYCERCLQYAHKTNPLCDCKVFRVEHPSYDPKYINKIIALNEEKAAKRYAISYNEESGDYCMMNGEDTIEILINGERYRVTAEAVIEYYVEKV